MHEHRLVFALHVAAIALCVDASLAMSYETGSSDMAADVARSYTYTPPAGQDDKPDYSYGDSSRSGTGGLPTLASAALLLGLLKATLGTEPLDSSRGRHAPLRTTAGTDNAGRGRRAREEEEVALAEEDREVVHTKQTGAHTARAQRPLGPGHPSCGSVAGAGGTRPFLQRYRLDSDDSDEEC